MDEVSVFHLTAAAEAAAAIAAATAAAVAQSEEEDQDTLALGSMVTLWLKGQIKSMNKTVSCCENVRRDV